MTSYTSIAQIINELKPNLKEFWSTINPNTASDKFKNLINEPYSHLNLFKIELLLIYMDTHNKIWNSSKYAGDFKTYLETANIDAINLFVANATYPRLKGFLFKQFHRNLKRTNSWKCYKC